MVGFQSKYYEQLPRFFKSKHGSLIVTKHHEIEPTLRYKKNDKLIILPEWDGRNWATFEEIMELHNQGRVGIVKELLNPFYILGKDNIKHHNKLRIETNSDEFVCSPYYYRLGYILK